MDADFLLAIQLQEQFDNEYETSLISSDSFEDNDFERSSKRRKVEAAGGGSDAVACWKQSREPERPLSIVDESWEMLDPNPDVRAMFLEFNSMFFWGKLSGVEVKWSPRMTLCAGVCSYEGRGGLCSIRLSEPLLKLRPRKDLVETLLHEMIHALLFVTQNNRDRDGHGPEFCKHMNRINEASGTKITVYHSFHDEVDVYRQHWWRCNGPCQSRRPYFGYVKRAMNRAPSSLDPWWEEHQRTCGGAYTKVKEPEGYGKKGKKDGKKDAKTTDKPLKTSKGSGSQDIRNIIPFSGKGFLLGATSQTSSSTSTSLSAPSSSLTFSPKKSSAPASPFTNLTSPVRSDQTKAMSSGAAAASGGKPPVKTSVGNTKAFVNINGSPVKIPKSRSSTGGHGSDAFKQRSIHDLFNIQTHRKSTSQPSSSETKRAVTSPSSSSINESVCVNTPGAAGRGQALREKLCDDRSGSATIFDFFDKTLSSNSASSKEQEKTKSAVAAASSSFTSLQPSGGLHAPSSSSSSVLMVSCPVCQTKVQESKINEHLDSCLS
uniref:DNA-dependent metalloprotease SPRTN n=1 Tax=Iconisemion striatum TaxID=60296 RepID=A0A1A7YBJ1_9TELE